MLQEIDQDATRHSCMILKAACFLSEEYGDVLLKSFQVGFVLDTSFADCPFCGLTFRDREESIAFLPLEMSLEATGHVIPAIRCPFVLCLTCHHRNRQWIKIRL